MKKILLAAVLAVGAFLAVVPGAAFADTYPAGCVPPTSGEPGAKLQFCFQTNQPNTSGTVTVEGDSVTTDAVTSASVVHTVTTGADGLAKFGVLLPATAKPGSTYTVTVKVGTFTKATDIHVANAQLTTESTASPSPTAEPSAASGGPDPAVFWWGGGAVALLAALGAVIGVRRSRKNKEAAE